MKENKVNDDKEIMDKALDAVAGGSQRDLIVQAIMNADGFKEEWKNHHDPNGVIDRFGSQEEMFSNK